MPSVLPHTPRKPTLEIIPNTRFIVFHGDEHNAQPVKLTGVVRLTTPESMSIKTVKLSLEGKRRIGWYYMGGMAAGEVSDKRTFFSEPKVLGTSGTHKINKGVIEWPFEYLLHPSMPESIEGMSNTWVVYNLVASVGRPGWNAKDIASLCHVRIVRTLGSDQMETTRSRTNADIWANKLSYSISIPTDAVVFGTSITADVELSPIRKGIRLGKVDLRLIESTVKRIQSSEVPDMRCDRSKTDETEVAKAEMDLPEDSRVMFDDETPDNPMMEDERYAFKATLPLPKSLRECRQDVDSHAINISHRFKLMVNIHNPEGHVSQLVCRLPVKIFISPNLPVDESHNVQVTTHISDAELNAQEAIPNAPPEYGRHQLDELYNDIQTGGFMSRAPSGSSTPFHAQSQRSSSDNLQSLGALADAPNGQINSALLQSRLANLQTHGHQSMSFNRHSPSGGNTPHNGYESDLPFRPTPPQAGSYFPPATSYGSYRGSPPHRSPTGSTPHSTEQSRRNSLGDDDHSVHQNDYDLGTLSRVPSYGAAVRTPGAMTPFFEGPPSYVDATSRPPSPIQRPSAAYVRSSTTGASTPTSVGSENTLGPMTALRGPGAHHRDHRDSNADEEARLRMMRARGD